MLQFTLNCSKAMIDIRILHHYYLVLQNKNKIYEQHLKSCEFDVCLSRNRHTMGNIVASVSNIPLPSTVKTTIHDDLLLWENTVVRNVYVDMSSALKANDFT